ncbi:MAG: D-glycerate dehydrogenase [Dehalococcoidia bacterium]
MSNSQKPRVFVSRTVFQDVIARLSEEAEVDVWPEPLPPSYEELCRRARGCAGLFTLVTDRVDAGLMDAAPTLKVVGQMAVGFDNIDVAAATERGIAVGNTPDVLSGTTADFAFALLMAGARRIVEGNRYVHEGRWQTWEPMGFMGQDIHGATLGIIGLGRIGREMAKRASGFDMKVLYHGGSPSEGCADAEEARSLDDLLERSDFVTVHAPLTDATHHMLGEAQFRRMKSTAVLINTARGPIVDQEALYHALSDGEIAHAALDVTDPEPIKMDDPLLTLDNVTIVPHIASASTAARRRMAEMTVDNILAGLRGEPLPTGVNNRELASV